MQRLSADDLVKKTALTVQYIKELPRHVTPDLTAAVKKWKSLVTEACLSLVLEPAQAWQDTTTQPPSSDYSIDLRTGSKVLPRRFGEQPKQIDEETKVARDDYEKMIEQGQIKCYKMNEKGDLFLFKPRSMTRSRWSSPPWQLSEVPSFIQQLKKFTFGDHMKNMGTATGHPVYTTDCCAYPNCHSKQGIKSNTTHLQLCENHDNELKYKLRHMWIPFAALKNYNAIKAQGESDPEASHHRVYYQLLPQLDKWIEHIDDIIPTQCTGAGAGASAIDAWLVIKLRPIRQLLMLMKSAIFVYRMHLNLNPAIGAAIIALFVHNLETYEVQEATVQGFVRAIRSVCATVTTIFIYFGIGILYTLDILYTDDAYLAIIFQVAGCTLMVMGAIMVVVAATPMALVGAVAVIGTGVGSFLIGRRMEREREGREMPHPCLIQIHLDLRLARERLWQWIE